MDIKLADIMDYVRDFADTDPTQEEWETLSEMVESFFNKREHHYTDEDWLPEDDFYTDKTFRERYGDDIDYDELGY